MTEVILRKHGFNDEDVDVGLDLEAVEIICDGLTILVDLYGLDDILVDVKAVERGERVRYSTRNDDEGVQLILTRF